MNAGRLVAPELDGVSDQVLEQLPELGAVSHHHRERVVGDQGPIFFDGDLEVVEGLVEDLLRSRWGIIPCLAFPRGSRSAGH